MAEVQTLLRGSVSVVRYRCTSGPSDAPYWEQYGSWSVASVRHGNFGCQCRGRRHELVPGSLLVGRPGDEYCCTHEHREGGDVCLSVHLSDERVDEIDPRRRAWVSGALPPLAQMIAAGEWLNATTVGDVDLGLDEAALMFAARFVQMSGAVPAPRVGVSPRERARIVESALRIAAQPEIEVDLQQLARDACWSPFHYLRRFSAVIGTTPHQYLVRCRIGRAAQLLVASERAVTEIALDVGFGDLSNFVRSFRRATGMSPRAWRVRGQGQRKICQVLRRAST
jgi:AraC-like DNA-binding protein